LVKKSAAFSEAQSGFLKLRSRRHPVCKFVELARALHCEVAALDVHPRGCFCPAAYDRENG